MTSFKKSPKTYQVVDAIVEALSSQTPRDRYLVGVDARFSFLLDDFNTCYSSRHLNAHTPKATSTAGQQVMYYCARHSCNNLSCVVFGSMLLLCTTEVGLF